MKICAQHLASIESRPADSRHAAPTKFVSHPPIPSEADEGALTGLNDRIDIWVNEGGAGGEVVR